MVTWHGFGTVKGLTIEPFVSSVGVPYGFDRRPVVSGAPRFRFVYDVAVTRLVHPTVNANTFSRAPLRHIETCRRVYIVEYRNTIDRRRVSRPFSVRRSRVPRMCVRIAALPNKCNERVTTFTFFTPRHAIEISITRRRLGSISVERRVAVCRNDDKFCFCLKGRKTTTITRYCYCRRRSNIFVTRESGRFGIQIQCVRISAIKRALEKRRDTIRSSIRCKRCLTNILLTSRCIPMKFIFET